MFKRQAPWLIPLLFLIAITPLTPYLDLTISNAFYSGNGTFSSNSFFDFLYNYGTYPAWIVSLTALVLIPWKRFRGECLLLVLTLAIGSGLIVHGILKEHWGRPRPRQTLEFGGTAPFHPYYTPQLNPTLTSKSFSCGHCTMGFYFFALGLVGRRLQSRFLTLFGFALAISLGMSLSLARIAQGGHYFSDTLVSALIMWWSAYFLDRIIQCRQEQVHNLPDSSPSSP